MCLPYSAARRERLSSSTLTPSTPQISAASSVRRQLFDISPGQLCSLRDEPLMIRTHGGWAGSSYSDWALHTASWAASQSVRSEEHTSELQSLMRISYAVFCLQKKT